MINTMINGKTLLMTLQKESFGESIINKHKLWDTYDLGSVALVFLEENKEEAPPEPAVSEDLQMILKLLMQFNQFSTEKKEIHNSFNLYKQYLGPTLENYMASLYQSSNPAYERIAKIKEEIETLKHELDITKQSAGRQNRRKSYNLKQRQDEISKELAEELRRSEELKEVLVEGRVKRNEPQKLKLGTPGTLITMGGYKRGSDIRQWDKKQLQDFGNEPNSIKQETVIKRYRKNYNLKQQQDEISTRLIEEVRRNEKFKEMLLKREIQRDEHKEIKLGTPETLIKMGGHKWFSDIQHSDKKQIQIFENELNYIKQETEIQKYRENYNLKQQQEKISTRLIEEVRRNEKFKEVLLKSIIQINGKEETKNITPKTFIKLRGREVSSDTQKQDENTNFSTQFQKSQTEWNRLVEKNPEQNTISKTIKERNLILEITKEQSNVSESTKEQIRREQREISETMETTKESVVSLIGEIENRITSQLQRAAANQLTEQTIRRVTGQRIGNLTFKTKDRPEDRTTEYLTRKFIKKINENHIRKLGDRSKLQKEKNLIQSHQITTEKLSLWMEKVNFQEYKELRRDISRLERSRLVTLLTKATNEEKNNLVKIFLEAGIPKKEGLRLKTENPQAAISTIIVKSSEETYERVKSLLMATVHSLEKEYGAFEKNSRQLEENSISIFLKRTENKTYQGQLSKNDPKKQGETLGHSGTFERQAEMTLAKQLLEAEPGQEAKVFGTVFEKIERERRGKLIFTNLRPQIGWLGETSVVRQTTDRNYLYDSKNFMNRYEYMVRKNIEPQVALAQIRRENVVKHNLLLTRTVGETYRKRSKEQKRILEKRELSEHLTQYKKEEKDAYQRSILNNKVLNHIINVELSKTRREMSHKTAFENRLSNIHSFYESFVEEQQLKYNLEKNRDAAIHSFHERFVEEQQLKYNLEKNKETALEKIALTKSVKEETETKIIQRERSQDASELKFVRKEKALVNYDIEQQKRLVAELSSQVREQGEKLQNMSKTKDAPGKPETWDFKVKELAAQEKASKEFVKKVKKEVMDTLEKEMRLERQRRGL